MTHILIIKTSSMGDIIHTLPALTDVNKFFPGVRFDWVIEEAFVEIPKWHPLVANVIPVPLRRFRKAPMVMLSQGEITEFLKRVRKKRYDYVIDAQGLIKSAIITRITRGLRCGLNYASAWEPLATLAYQKRIAVNPAMHAIARIRHLFSQALGYPQQDTVPDYGLHLPELRRHEGKPYLLFIHGTTWDTKEWPESYWIELIKFAAQAGYEVFIPWGNEKEKQRALRMADKTYNAKVLPKTSLTEIAHLLSFATGVVSVDTGLGHLAAALSVPTVSIYGPTDPREVGTMGLNQQHVTVNFKCSPCWNSRCEYGQTQSRQASCFASVPPYLVWDHLMRAIKI